MKEQLLASLVEAERTAFPPEQRPTDGLLESLHLHGYGRLTSANPWCCMEDAAALGHSHEAAQQAKVERLGHDVLAKLRCHLRSIRSIELSRKPYLTKPLPQDHITP